MFIVTREKFCANNLITSTKNDIIPMKWNLSIFLNSLSTYAILKIKSDWCNQTDKMVLRTDFHIDMSSDKDDRKCQSIYCKRKRSRKKGPNTMLKLFKHNVYLSLSIFLFIIILIASKRWDFNLTLEFLWNEKFKFAIASTSGSMHPLKYH